MKTRHILTLFASALLLNGCSSYEEAGPLPGKAEPETNPDAIIATTESLSRTVLDLSRYVVWTPGDQIRIFGATTTSGAIYTTQSDGIRTGVFLPDNEHQSVSDATRYAVYPAAAATGALSGSQIGIDLGGLAAQAYIPVLSAGVNVAPLPMVAASEDKSFVFKNICGAIQFKINDYQVLGIQVKSIAITPLGGEQVTGTATVDLATGIPVVTKAADKQNITIDCGDGVRIASGGDLSKGGSFIAFLPATTYEGFEFVVTDTEGRCYRIETKQAVTVTAGIVTPLAPLPLTIYYGTANCYRTAEAGTIEIDVTPYYTLSDNYVHESLKCLNAAGEVVGTPVSAKIVWQQAATDESGDVVSAPTIEGTTLKVPATGKKGNAVVAVCDASDVVLWSYHVWVSPVEDVNYLSATSEAFQMMDRNLGATSTTVKDRNTYGLFYQWGRKDPLARNLTAARPAAKPYETGTSDLHDTTEATGATGTIAYTVQHPNTRLLSSVNWYAGAGGNSGLWGFSESNSVKTVYDPCPAGYRVAGEAQFNNLAFTSKAACDANYGHLFVTDGTTTSYYPTSGYLLPASDACKYLEYRGFIWTNKTGIRLGYNNANVTLTDESNSAGKTVRCLKMK